MILSTSSSRAVSIRIGTSELFRMRRQSSTPSPSGRFRSRTTSAGDSVVSSTTAACAVAAVRTPYPAFRRYAATKDAIEVSSSTTRIVCWCCCSGLMKTGLVSLGRRSQNEPLRLVGQRRAECRLDRAVDAFGERVEPGRLVCLPLAVEHDEASSDRRDVDAGSDHADAIPPAEHTETQALAPVEDRPWPDGFLGDQVPPGDDLAEPVTRREVGHAQRAAAETAEHDAADVERHDTTTLVDREGAGWAGRTGRGHGDGRHDGDRAGEEDELPHGPRVKYRDSA